MSARKLSIAKTLELIGRIRIGLLTTVSQDGQIHTRPLETLEVDPAGKLWFFTGWQSPKVNELRQDLRVCVGYADPRRKTYVAVSGRGHVLRDTRKAQKLWTAGQRPYYSRGAKDPRLALLRVDIEHSEYWIAPGWTSQILASARAVLTGTPAQVLGKNFKS
jgi:general stress protein 26